MTRDDGQGTVAVIVAFNRIALLREALDGVLNQSHPVSSVVVVDNGSTDGTVDMVARDYPSVDLVVVGANTGGAGGFALGMAHAVATYQPAWIWVMDDDTVPEAAALEGLLSAVGRYEGEVTIAGSRAVWTNGEDHPMNTPRRRPFASAPLRAAAERIGCVPVRSSSFVSMLVAAEAIRERGLPVADYFIWNDDFEFSTRLLRGRVGLFVPDSEVVHKTVKLGSTDVDPGDRFFFEVRNKLWLFLRSASLNPWEKVVYGAASARRWARAVRRSSDRKRLLRAGSRGLVAGLRAGPRSNEEVLGGTEAGRLVMRKWSRVS